MLLSAGPSQNIRSRTPHQPFFPAQLMEQSRLRLLAEFENMRFGERVSTEVMPSPGCQPRTPQPAPPSRPHRLASLWGNLAARTQSPFAQPSQQSRPFDSETPIYSAKASLAHLPKTQTPIVQASSCLACNSSAEMYNVTLLHF